MCQQTLSQHLYTHISHGSLTNCGTPSSPWHNRTQTITSSPSVCSSCVTRGTPVTNIPPQRPILPLPPPPYASYAPPTIFLFSSAPPIGFIQHQTRPQIIHQPPHQTSQFILLPHFSTPPPFPPYIPGQVPSWVPREVRYELIRNVPIPVEHFQGPAAPVAFGRGYNTFHGFDSGPLPPGLGATPLVNFSEMDQNLNLAVSTQSEDASGIDGRVKNAKGLKQVETEQGVDNYEKANAQGSKKNREEGSGSATSSKKASSSAEKFGVPNELHHEVPAKSTEDDSGEGDTVRQ